MSAPTCPGCHHVVAATTSRPAVSAQSLGPGTFHLDCARTRWAKLAAGKIARRDEQRTRRQALGRQLAAARVAAGEPAVAGARPKAPKTDHRRTTLSPELAAEIYG